MVEVFVCCWNFVEIWVKNGFVCVKYGVDDVGVFVVIVGEDVIVLFVVDVLCCFV